MAWRQLILLTTLSILSASVEADLFLKEGDHCPKMPDFPQSRCTKTCLTIAEHEPRRYCNRAQGMICCPNQPSQRHFHTQKPPIPSESYAWKYRHMAALKFLTPNVDDYIFRCAAVLVRPNFVLTSALCGETPSDVAKSPSFARFGVQAPYQSFEMMYDNQNYSIRNPKNDLSLLKLNGNASNEFVAHICTQQEFDNAQNLVAMGHSQHPDKDCDLFEIEVALRQIKGCENVEINTSVKDIGGRTHFCVQPINPRWPKPGECVQCLRGSGSVLHAVLPGGSICVAGIATPTSSNCHVSDIRLLYTSLIGAEIANFILKAI